ncbi:MAG: patatin-like phospholipase family protein [Xanthomonadales bacterium]|nr:patatin-like phospholipase family protein [Xanthomonadales bacterium]
MATEQAPAPGGAPSSAGTAAVILPGGGARGAYQVGVLKAVAELASGSAGPDANPFPVVCGTSAGAINAAVVASHAHEFADGIARLEHFWSTMHCARIYRTDPLFVFRSGLHWAASLALGARLLPQPKSLLDNTPLRRFLERNLRLDGIDTAIRQGALRGVSVTASGYSCAAAISFFQAAPEVTPWSRERRRGEPAKLAVAHLLASAALPLLFPAERIGHEYFGDGGMRLLAPLAPAIHLGADRLLVISTRDERPDPAPAGPAPYPALGEIGGYLLDTIFMDTLTADLNRLNRINHTLQLLPAERHAASGLRRIETLVIRPSRDLRDVTHEHVRDIPWAVRTLLRSLGGWGRDWRLASYLLFEAPYCRELMRLGYEDGKQQADQLRAFLGLD